MSTTIKEALHPDTFGLVALILISQIGGRLIVDEVHQNCGEALDSPLVKIIVVYSVVYLGTKDKFSSLIWTVLITLAWNAFVKGPGQRYCARPHDGHHSFSM